MKKPYHSGKKILTLLVYIATFISLLWSASLIGKGIGQLFPQSSTEAENKRKNLSNFASVANNIKGVFQYGGSTAWAPLRLVVDSVIQLERPELQLRYVQPQKEPPGSNPGIKMLLAGQLDFVQSSYPLTSEEYELAKKKGLSLKQIAVAVDSVVVAVHPQLSISGLTLDQLQAIYTGQIVNWRELGGADLAITPYSRPPSTGGMVDFFRSRVMENQNFGSNVEFVPTTTQALRQLENNPGGIYYGSAPAIINQCTVKPLQLGRQEDKLVAPYQEPLVATSECPKNRNKLNIKTLRNAEYPLTHYLYVVFIQSEDNKQEIGQVYANFLRTNQGQKLIHQAGFISLD